MMIDCKLMLHLCPNFNEIWKFFWNSLYLSFDQNFNEFVFDQLVIVIDNPDMED